MSKDDRRINTMARLATLRCRDWASSCCLPSRWVWLLLLVVFTTLQLGMALKVTYQSGPHGVGPYNIPPPSSAYDITYLKGRTCGDTPNTRAWDKQLGAFNDSSYNPSLKPITEVRTRYKASIQAVWGGVVGPEHGYTSDTRKQEAYRLLPGEVEFWAYPDLGFIGNITFYTNTSREVEANWTLRKYGNELLVQAMAPDSTTWTGPPIAGSWYLAYISADILGFCMPFNKSNPLTNTSSSYWITPVFYFMWAADTVTGSEGSPLSAAAQSPSPPPPSAPTPGPSPRTAPPPLGPPSIIPDCTVKFTSSDSSSSTATVACSSKGMKRLVTVAPPPEGVAVQGHNVGLNDRSCWSTVQIASKTSNVALALLQICSSASSLVLRLNISGVAVPQGSAAAALSVVSTGAISLADSIAELVSGGTAVHVAAASNINVMCSRFEQNHAPDVVWGGGLAVVVSKSMKEVVIADCMFLGNTAGAGAGAWVDARAAKSDVHIVVKGTTYFEGCTSTSLYGGGLRVEADRTKNVTVSVGGTGSFVRNADVALMVSFVNSTKGAVFIEGNVAFQHNNNSDNQGGAAYLEFGGSSDGAVTLQGHASFWDNRAGDMSSWAVGESTDGGSSNSNVSITLGQSLAGTTSVLIASAGNTGSRQDVGSTKFYGGGAVYVGFSNSTSGTVRVRGSVHFFNNLAANDGGGMYVNFIQSSRGTAVISGGVRFEQNSAGTWGGGAMLAFERAKHANSSILKNARFLDNVAGDTGGGLAVDMSSVDVGAVAVNDAVFPRNRAAFVGGGLAVYGNYSRNVSVSMDHSSLDSNGVVQGYGGGMVLVAGPPTSDQHNEVTLSITNSNFTHNRLGSGVGGGLLVDGTSRVLRMAACDGGRILSCKATATLRGVFFFNNTATLGGGMYMINTQCITNTSVFISNNASQSGGGAFFKGTARVGFANTTFKLNRAIVQGGGLATALGDDFQDSVTICNNCTIQDNSAAAGAGAYHFGGSNLYSASLIMGNVARQHGGGIEYQDTCGGAITAATVPGGQAQPSKQCGLKLSDGTSVSSNSALVGGGVFLGIPNSPEVDISNLRNVSINNTARYAKDVAEAPDVGSLKIKHVTKDPVASSTGDVGRTGLVVSTSRCFTRLQVEFCSVQAGMFLTGSEEATGAATAAAAASSAAGSSIDDTCASSAAGTFNAIFTNLRVLGAVPNTYCLRLFADYPLVEPQEFNLTIRSCDPGEFCSTTSGCTPCPAGSVTFSANGTCRPCSSTNVDCRGGAKYVPKPGFWHSRWDSSAVMQCPNKGACSTNRTRGTVHAISAADCQAARNQTCATEGWAADYPDLLCARGYKGRLCMQCARHNGSGLMFRCHKCKSRLLTAVLLLLVFAVISLVVAAIGLRAVSQQVSSALLPGGGPMPSADITSKDADSASPPSCSNANGTPQASQQRSAAALARSAARMVDDMLVADVFKVLVVYLQYIGILRNLVIDWPRGLRGLMDLGKVVLAPDSSGWVSLDCLGRLGGGAQLWIRILLSLLTVVAASGLACLLLALWTPVLKLLHALGRRMGYLWRLAAGPPRERPPYLDVAIATAVVGLFVKYANLVAISLSAFACMEVDGSRYWARDPDLLCFHGRHLQQVVPVGVLGLVVICVLVPLGILYVGRRRDVIIDTAAVNQHNRRYGFLYRLYHDRFRPWEAVLCMQTVALVSVDHFARQLGALYQLVWIMVVLLTVSALWAWWRPFRSDKLTALYLAGMHCLMFTCLVMMLMLRGYRLNSRQGTAELSTPSRVVAAVLMAAINILFVLACIAAMLLAVAAPVLEPGSLVWHSIRSKVSDALCFAHHDNASPAHSQGREGKGGVVMHTSSIGA